jgi:D-cysteine desulfhydrase
LQEAQEYGMQLVFVSRTAFSEETSLIADMQAAYPDYLVVPQGGQSPAGVQGAAEIPALTDYSAYTHIACACGTGTMLAGITQALLPGQQALGISSLKVSDPHNNTLHSFVESQAGGLPFTLLYAYHFGGYARKNNALLAFMNDLYHRHGLPTDFVYTAKLFYGIDDLICNHYFTPGARLLAIHSGGLQGNRSLPAGTLDF